MCAVSAFAAHACSRAGLAGWLRRGLAGLGRCRRVPRSSAGGGAHGRIESRGLWLGPGRTVGSEVPVGWESPEDPALPLTPSPGTLPLGGDQRRPEPLPSTGLTSHELRRRPWPCWDLERPKDGWSSAFGKTLT